MQKKLIALAIAGLASSGAFAQSNVVIYGVLDIGYVNAQSDATRGAASGDYKFSGIGTGTLSGSRLGFKAEEDLGGGMKAGALYEFGTLNPDGGAASGAASVSGMASIRQSYGFLSGTSWGAVQLGRIYGPGTNAAGKFDAEAASGFGPVSRMTTSMGLAIDGAGNNAARQNNSIAYMSPTWSGFSAHLQYSFGENGEAGTNGSKRLTDGDTWGLGLDYTNGPLAVGFVYSDASDFGGQAKTAGSAPGIDVTEWFLGASYDFGMAKVFGSYQDFDIDNTANLLSGDTTNGIVTTAGARAKSSGDIWNIGVVVPVMKAGSVRLSYANLNRSMRNVAGAKMNADADGWALTYQYAMSKRTTLYVGYTDISNDKNSQVRVGSIVNAPGAGNDSSGYAMGMRHTF